MAYNLQKPNAICMSPMRPAVCDERAPFKDQLSLKKVQVVVVGWFCANDDGILFGLRVSRKRSLARARARSWFELLFKGQAPAMNVESQFKALISPVGQQTKQITNRTENRPYAVHFDQSGHQLDVSAPERELDYVNKCLEVIKLV